MIGFKKLAQKTTNLLLALALVSAQLFAPISAIVPTATAAQSCLSDTAGANDEPGQKDLTRLCQETAPPAGTEQVVWDWDDTGTSGNNTMDACGLFDDADADLNTDFSVCVTTEGSTATLDTITIYSCGNDKNDRCTNPDEIPNSQQDPYATICTVNQQNTDPFPAGDFSPADAVATCNFVLSDLNVANLNDLTLTDVCSYPSREPNSDPSDCVIIQNDPVALVEVIKNVVPDGGGLFNLSVDGPGNNDTTTVNNLGDNGTTGIIAVTPPKNGSANATVSETAGTNTSLTSYSSSISCVNRVGGAVVASGQGTSLQVAVSDGSNLICTITNTLQQGSITLIKNVINNNGGTADENDFGLTIGGVSVTSGQTRTLTPGSYAIDEAGLTGYSFVSVTGTGCPAQLGGNVVLANGQNITCTITNDDVAPSLMLVKQVTNDDGGTRATSEWTLSATGADQSPTNISGAGGAVSGSNFKADTYTLDETGPADYTEGTWSCTNGVTVNGNNQITLTNGQSTTCTITNNDVAPTLKLVKLVTNNNGGSQLATAWTLRAQYPNLTYLINEQGTATNQAGTAAQTNTATAVAGTTYTLSESGPSGYAPSAWSCDAGTLDGNEITIPLNTNVTCTIVNDDLSATLVLIKLLPNNDGGTATQDDFDVFINGQLAQWGSNTVNAGSHTVSEQTLAGYLPSGWSVDCDAEGNVTLANGETKTCQITNDDIAPTLALRKVVVNDNGGDDTAGEWTLKAQAGNDPALINAAGNENQSGTEATTNATTAEAGVAYTLSESGPSGYTPGSWSCTGGNLNGNVVTLALDEDVVCTITNNDQAAELVLVKNVINDDGGTATQASFTPLLDSDPSTWGTHAVDAGTFTVGEQDPSSLGYTFNGVSCYVTGSPASGINHPVSIDSGESRTCVVTNDDIAPTLTLVKEVVNDNSGGAEANDFTLTADPTVGDTISGNGTVTSDARANTAYSLSESGPSGYHVETDWSCDGGIFDAQTNTITLDLNQEVTCTVVNDDDPHPDITIVKSAQQFANQGEVVTYTFTVENTGDEPLANVEVTDTKINLITYVSGDTNEDDILDVDEVWTFTGQYTVPVDQTESVVNVAEVCADPREGEEECDEDNHELFILAEIIVTKYNDYNRNGRYDLGETEVAEPLLPSWEFTLTGEQSCEQVELTQFLISVLLDEVCEPYNYDKTQTTGGDGTTTFTDVRPSVDHQLSETQQAGWILSNIDCGERQASLDGDTYYFSGSSIGQGETINCFVGNYRDAYMLIEKTNNRPNPTDVGDIVTYTLTVTVPEDSNPVYNATVTDLPPEGFEYIPGSETATKGSLTSPYASPGVWTLDDLFPGEVVTLTYQTRIANSASPGTYPDLAFAEGCNINVSGDCDDESEGCEVTIDEVLICEEENSVLANVTNIDEEGTPFVGTQVTIKAPQVLAANTTVLVNTGTADIWRNLAVGTLLIGVALAILYRREQKGGRA